MTAALVKIAGQCDGVRCDMAMLILPEVFERTWNIKAPPFWPAAIRRVREQVPGFLFLAEVYWDLEWTLQQQGFDYTYDKRLYDRLRAGHARPVREHLPRGARLSNEARPVSREPRRAARGGDILHGRSQGSGRHLVPGPGAALLSPGPVRGPQDTGLASLVPRAHRATGPRVDSVLRLAPGSLAQARRPRGPVAIARVHPGVGRELDVGRLPRVRVAGAGRRASPRHGQLCAQPGPVLCPAAVRGSRRQSMPAGRSAGSAGLRSRWHRPAIPRPVPGRCALAGIGLRAVEDERRDRVERRQVESEHVAA